MYNAHSHITSELRVPLYKGQISFPDDGCYTLKGFYWGQLSPSIWPSKSVNMTSLWAILLLALGRKIGISQAEARGRLPRNRESRLVSNGDSSHLHQERKYKNNDIYTHGTKKYLHLIYVGWEYWGFIWEAEFWGHLALIVDGREPSLPTGIKVKLAIFLLLHRHGHWWTSTHNYS